MNYEIDNFSYLVLSILSEGYNYYGRILEGRLVLDIDLILQCFYVWGVYQVEIQGKR